MPEQAGQGMAPNELAQYGLCESYMQTAEDAFLCAEKVKYFNQTKNAEGISGIAVSEEDAIQLMNKKSVLTKIANNLH
ncbi:hypothetical protein L0244_23015 [bacterium]|nr:hypothetical protein [bacterium]MCI0615866.1 hypothetical protein [bacterium]